MKNVYTNHCLQQKILLRRPEVLVRTGFKSTSALYRAISLSEFPKPIKLTDSGRSVAWPSDQVDAWIEKRISFSQK